MKKVVLLVVSALSAGLSAAQEVGTVISSTPVIQQVAVPRQVCSTTAVLAQPQKSGAGAVMGAIAGGAMGNAVGQGGGRAAATMIGIMGGAILGDRVEGPDTPQVQNVQQCATQMFYENRAVAYNVVYEYAGKQYAVQMPNDPGPVVKLQIAPLGAAPAPSASVTSSTYVQPVYAPPVYAAPVYVVAPPPVVAYPYYAPVGVRFNLDFYGGPHSRGYRHWH